MFKAMKVKNVSNKIKTKVLNITNISQKQFLSGTNSRYAEKMYDAWKKDPTSVHVSWKTYFENLDNDDPNPFIAPPTLDPSSKLGQVSSGATLSEGSSSYARESIMINQLIRAYQKNGYLKAVLDPLRVMENHFSIFKNINDLHYTTLGFTEKDLDKEYVIPSNLLKEGLTKKLGGQKIKLRSLIDLLEASYCGKIGVEFKHISNREEVNFIQNYMESKWIESKYPKQEKLDIFKKLVWATKFEYFCDVKFTTKRFGVEGLETMITGIDTFFESMSDKGVKDITLGMAHRGRLNVLANLFGKPMKAIFKEFMEKSVDNEGFTYWRSGDVKYHLGYSNTKVMKNGKPLKLEILPNPSHLECINPVVQGKVRAKQHFNADYSREE